MIINIGNPDERSISQVAESIKKITASVADEDRVAAALGDASGDRGDHPGIRAVGDHRLDARGVDVYDLVEDCPVVGVQRLPVLHRAVPGLALRGARATLQVCERGLVGGHHAGARAGLDGHVADRHAAVHRQCLDRGTAVLDDVARAAVHADAADDREHEVLGGHARREPVRHLDGEPAPGRRPISGSAFVLQLGTGCNCVTTARKPVISNSFPPVGHGWSSVRSPGKMAGQPKLPWIHPGCRRPEEWRHSILYFRVVPL